MKRIKENPLSTAIGVIFILFAMALLFIETRYNIPLWGIGLINVFGILLLFAKDKLIDILTLGLSRLIQDRIDKNK